jgi:hypothetical protein
LNNLYEMSKLTSLFRNFIVKFNYQTGINLLYSFFD